MDRKRIVITGIGVVSPIGTGKHAFWDGLKSGKDGIRDVSLFDTSSLSSHKAGEIADFDAGMFLGRKGLKYLDRSTQLLGAATSLALADGTITPTNGSSIGLAVGTTFGSVDSISGFDVESLKEGPRYVNPMAFPKTVINSPAGHTAIKFGLTGLNATLSTGSASSLHALSFAADAIDAGRADVILAGGVEELCLPSYLGFSRLKLLSGSRQDSERAAPFDVNRNGLVLGEGAVILVLESSEHARARGATAYVEIRGFGSAHDAYHSHRYNKEGVGAVQAMRLALEDAGLTATDVDYLCASASGSRTGDAMEAHAIKAVFGERSSLLIISSIKSMVGECLGASGAMEVAASLMALNTKTIPPTINFNECEPSWALGGLSQHAKERSVRLALVNAFGCDGNNASLLLGRCDEV